MMERSVTLIPASYEPSFDDTPLTVNDYKYLFFLAQKADFLLI